MQHVVVYDTNVLLSGIHWSGPPSRCLELARQRRVEGLTCQGILDELEDKLLTKLEFSPSKTTETITDLLGFLRMVKITNTLKVVVNDPDDDKVIECAVLGSATHIITGDKRHLLRLGNYQEILIVAAAGFLKQFP